MGVGVGISVATGVGLGVFTGIAVDFGVTVGFEVGAGLEVSDENGVDVDSERFWSSVFLINKVPPAKAIATTTIVATIKI